MGRVFVFALTGALNPSLLAAVTVILTLSRPKRLLLGYLAGAVLVSVSLGLVLVFSLHGSSTSSTSKRTVDPALDLVLGGLILLIVFVVGTGRDRRRRAWSERKREVTKNKPPPRWKRQLNKGSARDTFVVGALLSFPGASYIAGMDLLGKQPVSAGVKVLVVLAFNAIALVLLEVPLLGYALRPEWTAATINRFTSWLSRSGGRVALIGGAIIGVALIARGAGSLLG